MVYHQTRKLIALSAIFVCRQVANAGDNSNLHPIPDDQPAFCQPIQSTQGSTTFGEVCVSTTGDSVELLINVTAADEGCCLKETHICNYPAEREFTQGCELVTIYAFNMSTMYNFMCEGDPCQTFQLDGHATLQCDDPNGGADCIGFCIEDDAEVCGGIAGTECPRDYTCVDNPKDDCDPHNEGSDCDGICIEQMLCGGIGGVECPKGYACVDNPEDGCDHEKGGADCGGICKLLCGGIAGIECPEGYTCVDDPEDDCDPENTADIEQEMMMSAMFFVNFGCGDCYSQANGCDKCSSDDSTCVASYADLLTATAGAADGDTISICTGAIIEVTDELTIDADEVAICCQGPHPCIIHTVSGNHGILHATGDSFALCGVTLMNGNIPESSGVGGNLRITGSGNHTINGCRLVNGTASGGGNLYVKPSASAGGRQGTVAIADSIFETGAASGSGGGIWISSVLDVTMDTVDFVGNSAGTAGGAFVDNVDNVEIMSCTFLDNTASFHGGGFYVGGSSDPIDSLKVMGSSFINNTATQFRGGAGYIWSNVVTYIVNTNSGSSNSAGTCDTIFVLGPLVGSSDDSCLALDGTVVT